jgi:hypothetical protein
LHHAGQFDAFISDPTQLGIERDGEASDRALRHLLVLRRKHRSAAFNAMSLDLT